jgi:two-component system, LytTR family, sensor kinase
MPLPIFSRLSRNALFWTLQAGGWTAFALTQSFGALLYERPAVFHQVVAIAATAGFLLTAPLRYVFRALWNRSPAVLIGGALFSCYVASLALRAVINTAYTALVDPSRSLAFPLELFAGTLYTLYLLLCWAALYFGFKYYETLQRQREAALRAAALAQEAQLKMLRYQLNPHFLFNTLNAISTLILDNQNRTANAAVMRLSEFLRYTLDQDPMKKVSLRQEIELLNLYLGTERLRFAERLRIEFAVEESALEALVPSLLLQPLIENAVKHAISPREEGGCIRIEGRVRGAMLEIAVIDDGPGLRDAQALVEGRGVGVRNTRERLAVLYGEHHRFAVLNTRPGMRIEIGLPFDRAPAPAGAAAPTHASAGRPRGLPA